jgi:uncharacterized damage-inducible protein DinB
MEIPFPEPTSSIDSRAEVLLTYLDYFRSVVIGKLDGLSEEEIRGSRLPSGWSPLSLVKHLTYVERRWLVWGFEGEDVGDPWGDWHDGRWFVERNEPKSAVLDAFLAQGAVSRKVVERHDLADLGAPGERWEGEPPATLERVLFHLLQEYARHVGQLDVVRETIDGQVGE